MGACLSGEEEIFEEPYNDAISDSDDEGGYNSLGCVTESPEKREGMRMTLSLELPAAQAYDYEYTDTTDISNRPRSDTIDTEGTDVMHPLKPEHHAATATHMAAASLTGSSMEILLEADSPRATDAIELVAKEEELDEDDYEDTMHSMFGDPDEGLQKNSTVIKWDTYDRTVRGTKAGTLELALVQKHHSLWGEFIYNAARVLADLTDSGVLDVEGKSVVELGAGAGLPAIVAALNGASSVAITDYGRDHDRGLVEAIDKNIEILCREEPELACVKNKQIKGFPYVWGNDVDDILTVNGKNSEKFDVVIMADCIFNRSVHKQLVDSMTMLMTEDTGVCYCSFSHHDPQKTELDLVFLTLCEEAGYKVEHIHKEQRRSYPFFEEDGMDEDRGWVYVCRISKVQ